MCHRANHRSTRRRGGLVRVRLRSAGRSGMPATHGRVGGVRARRCSAVRQERLGGAIVGCRLHLAPVADANNLHGHDEHEPNATAPTMNQTHHDAVEMSSPLSYS